MGADMRKRTKPRPSLHVCMRLANSLRKTRAPRRVDIEQQVIWLHSQPRVRLELLVFGFLRITTGGLRSEARIHGAQRGHFINGQAILIAELGLKVAYERVQGLLRCDEAPATRRAQEVRDRGSGEAGGDREGLRVWGVRRK